MSAVETWFPGGVATGFARNDEPSMDIGSERRGVLFSDTPLNDGEDSPGADGVDAVLFGIRVDSRRRLGVFGLNSSALLRARLSGEGSCASMASVPSSESWIAANWGVGLLASVPTYGPPCGECG